MEGAVKITVIATGFDRARTATVPAAQSARVTPVDMSQYGGRTQIADRQVANSGRVVVARRPSLDLPFPPRQAVSADTAGDDDESPLDVPAFLRRQEG
jgi:hypothetical protein